MVVVQLNGGLANQMFQYAAAKSLALHHGVPLTLDISLFQRDVLPDLEIPRDFELYSFKGVTEKIINQKVFSQINFLQRNSIFEKLKPNYKKEIYSEPFYHFDKNFFKSKKNVLLKGGWQSEKYFSNYKDVIKNTFLFKDELIDRIKQMNLINSKIESVGVHVRRSDYLRKKIIYEWHGIMGQDYYLSAFELLSSKLQNFIVYYFTDDVEWVQNNLAPLKNGEIVSGHLTQTHYEDFYLMSQCKHNIIANSSFSWWAAWLNKNPDKIVIAPKRWFNKGPKDTQDLIPEGWLRI